MAAKTKPSQQDSEPCVFLKGSYPDNTTAGVAPLPTFPVTTPLRNFKLKTDKNCNIDLDAVVLVDPRTGYCSSFNQQMDTLSIAAINTVVNTGNTYRVVSLIVISAIGLTVTGTGSINITGLTSSANYVELLISSVTTLTAVWVIPVNMINPNIPVRATGEKLSCVVAGTALTAGVVSINIYGY